MSKSVTGDKIRVKVQAVREIVRNANNEQIVLVLQYYDNDVERAVTAFQEDGAREALGQWHYQGSNKTVATKKKKNKNKHKNQAAVVENGVLAASSNGTGAGAGGGGELTPDSVELESVVNSPLSELPPAPLVLDQGADGDRLAERDVLGKIATDHSETAPAAAESIAKTAVVNQTVQRPAASQDTANNSYQQQGKRSRDQTAAAQASNHSSKTPGSQPTAASASNSKKPQISLEKSSKDLQRQTVALERLKIVLGESLEKSYKRISEVFKEIHKELNDRELELTSQLNKVKFQSNEILQEQETKAQHLRQQCDRAPTMNESDLLQLRADIKQYVGDRKIYEDMCSVSRFSCNITQLIDDVRSFGQVSSIKLPTSSSRRTSTVSPPACDQVSHKSVAKSSSFVTTAPSSSDVTDCSPVRPTSSLHVLTQSDSLTRYEESIKNRPTSVHPQNHGVATSHEGRHHNAATSGTGATERGYGHHNNRGSRGRGRGVDNRGRDYRQGGGRGSHTETSGSSFSGSRTFYSSRPGVSNGGSNRGRGYHGNGVSEVHSTSASAAGDRQPLNTAVSAAAHASDTATHGNGTARNASNVLPPAGEVPSSSKQGSQRHHKAATDSLKSQSDTVQLSARGGDSSHVTSTAVNGVNGQRYDQTTESNKTGGGTDKDSSPTHKTQPTPHLSNGKPDPESVQNNGNALPQRSNHSRNSSGIGKKSAVVTAVAAAAPTASMNSAVESAATPATVSCSS